MPAENAPATAFLEGAELFPLFLANLLILCPLLSLYSSCQGSRQVRVLLCDPDYKMVATSQASLAAITLCARCWATCPFPE